MASDAVNDTHGQCRRAGPLRNLRVLEFAGIGPAPFGCMQLSDLGADVVVIDRPEGKQAPTTVLDRGRRSILLDLKSPQGLATALALIEQAEALVEGFRPGVMERLGLGPEVALSRNPRLVYGRMTGFGQTGPLAHAAGHDINYIALSGALAAIGPPGDKPVPPLNLVGDFAGALHFVCGLLAALLHARQTGEGQVVDCAMTDSAIGLMGLFHSLRESGAWRPGRGRNFLDGGAHYYGTYECADGAYIALGAIEPKFYGELRRRLALTDAEFDAQNDPADWPRLADRLTQIFKTRTRAEWCRLLEGTDACVTPVLELDEVAAHAHNAARGSMTRAFGAHQPAPVPRFSTTPGAIQGPPPVPGEHGADVLRDWGIRDAGVAAN